MKIKTIILGIVLTSATAFASPRTINLVCTIAGTAQVQNAQTVLGATLTDLAPVKYSVTSNFILQQAAQDEFNIGNYGFSSFPSGTQLVLVDYPDNDGNDYFVAMFAGGVICDLSNLINWNSDTNFVTAGKHQAAPGHLSKFTETGVAGFSYDNTSYGGTINFYMAGLMTATGTDTATKDGIFYTEKWTGSEKVAVGTGSSGGKSLYISGTIAISGSKQFVF